MHLLSRAAACVTLATATTAAAQICSPAALGAVGTPDIPLDVVRVGDSVAVADGESGVQVVNVSDPANPFIEGAINTPGYAVSLVARGNQLFVCDQTGGLRVILLQPSSFPTLRETYFPPSGILRAVDLSGDVAYIVTDGVGRRLFSLDIRDTRDITLIGFADLPDSPFDLLVSDDIVYVATFESGVLVYDVRDPNQPKHIATVPGLFFPGRLALDGETLFIVDQVSGLVTVDVADPSAPRVLASLPLDGLLTGVVVDGEGRAYVPASLTGLHVVDVASPSQPSLLSTYAPPSGAQALALDGELAYVADTTIGLSVVDISSCVARDPADFDGDGAVGPTDLGVLLDAWGSAGSLADLDGDGVVGSPDLGLLLAAWGG